MRFIIDKEQLKPGLIIFRRGDVGHDNFYCRVRIQNEDRYKTISLRTADRHTARDYALDQYADIRFRVKHDVPVFNRPFSQVAEEYADAQQRRANAGELSQARAMNVKNKVDGPLKAYVGTTQVHLIGQDRWTDYPLWRRENGKGRRNGIISDATIRIEMTIFAAIMNYAVSKKYVPASHRFEGMPKLKSSRRDEFTLEEYRKLHTVGRKWMREATTPQGVWYRQMCYNFILIMCNTGMRPPEAKNLRWRDISTAKDKDGQEILVIYVQGKGKTRKLIAPVSVGKYLDRVRALSKATKLDDPVFTIINGKAGGRGPCWNELIGRYPDDCVTLFGPIGEGQISTRPCNKMSNRVARTNFRLAWLRGGQDATRQGEYDGHFKSVLDTAAGGARMNPALKFSDLATRHSGVSSGIGLSYEEAARVCLDRHHGSPVTMKIRDNALESEADADWQPADVALKNAWANEIDTTEAGAYGLALAAVELTRGLVAIRRAETRTGADYYIDAPGAEPDDLETAIRLEVSGVSDGNTSVIESRLKQKLEQTSKGNSNLPAIATVVGFSQLRIVIADLGGS